MYQKKMLLLLVSILGLALVSLIGCQIFEHQAPTTPAGGT
jgi:hypothetical protein